VKRLVLRFLGIRRPTVAQRQRTAMEDGVRAGLEYIVQRYGSARPPGGSVRWYDHR
jgi:hypothetical protein